MISLQNLHIKIKIDSHVNVQYGGYKKVIKKVNVFQSSIVNDGIREFYTSYEKIPHAQKAQNAHKRIKTKTVLNTNKNI